MHKLISKLRTTLPFYFIFVLHNFCFCFMFPFFIKNVFIRRGGGGLTGRGGKRRRSVPTPRNFFLAKFFLFLQIFYWRIFFPGNRWEGKGKGWWDRMDALHSLGCLFNLIKRGFRVSERPLMLITIILLFEWLYYILYYIILYYTGNFAYNVHK